MANTAALEEARRRNSCLSRADIEWAVDGSGNLYLTDAPAFIAWNTQTIDRQHEADRRRWKAGQDAA